METTNKFKKSLDLLNQSFASSSVRNPQYLKFHRTFKREITQFLKPYCVEIQISKPNHFDFSGFFKTNSGLIYWFRLEDLRWDKDRLLIRTAKDFKDYTGGNNHFIKMIELEKGLIPFLNQ